MIPYTDRERRIQAGRIMVGSLLLYSSERYPQLEPHRIIGANDDNIGLPWRRVGAVESLLGGVCQDHMKATRAKDVRTKWLWNGSPETKI